MRWLLALFAFLALAAAPLGIPAEARAANDHCAEMAGMDHGKSDHGGTAKEKSCCTALAAALPAASGSAEAWVPRALLIAATPPSPAGIFGTVEVPPPRI